MRTPVSKGWPVTEEVSSKAPKVNYKEHKVKQVLLLFL